MAEVDRRHGSQVETRELVVPRVTDAERAAALDDRDDREFYASQWQLMRRRFFRHKVAVGATIALAVLYLAALFSPFLSPHDPVLRSLAYKEAPPMVVPSINRGAIPRCSITRLVQVADVTLAVHRPSTSFIVRPASLSALAAAPARISISVRPPASPQPAVPIPTMAARPRSLCPVMCHSRAGKRCAGGRSRYRYER